MIRFPSVVIIALLMILISGVSYDVCSVIGSHIEKELRSLSHPLVVVSR